ncbi:MAG: sigma-70 family RNA polymerase sigma factor [Candidatus Poribacteria bacterium]|nr:sigma-70 family RNA polymerase sigma factor [Candidatus Poribacteria bacterium]
MVIDDVQLIHDILSGDETAFNILVKKYQKNIHSFAWRKIGDYHIAEEITQDTFLQVYDKLSTLKDPNQFTGWLYVIANRRCIAWLRKKRLVIQSLELISEDILEKIDYSSYLAEQRENASDERRREIVDSLLEKLPETQRITMILYYLGEMSCKAISKYLNVSLNTVKSRLNRARNRLQQEEPIIHEILDQIQGDNFMENQKPSIPVPVGSLEGDVTTWGISEGAIARLGRGSEPKMAFSPDGKYLAIGTYIGLWLYDLVTLSPIALWEAEEGVVESVAFSPNGKWIAANKSGGNIKILDVQNGTCLTEMKSESHIHSMTLSYDNWFLAAAYYTTPDVVVWNTETGKPFARFTPDTERAGFYRPISFSPDTRLIVSTCRSGATDEVESIIVWSMESREQIARVSAHTNLVTTLCFSPCGQFLASGGEDGTVYVWDVNTWQQVQCYTDYGDVYRIIPSYTSDGILRAAVINYDDTGPATVSVYDLVSDDQLYTDQVWGNSSYFSHIGEWGNTVEFLYGTQLACECRHESIIVWTLDHPYRRQFTHSPISFPDSMVFSQDGKTLAVEYYHEGVVLWDIESKRSRPAINDISAGKNQFIYKTVRGKLYASSINNDSVKLWETDSDGIPLIEAKGRQYWSAFPALAPTGTLFAYACEDGNIQVWDVQSGTKLHVMTHPLEPSDNNDDEDEGDFVYQLEFSNDGKLLVSESKARNIRLWDMELGEEIELFPSDKVTGFRFCCCGQHLVFNGDEEIPYWDITHREFCEDDTCQYESKQYEIENRLSLPKACEYIEKPVFTTCGQYIAFITSWNKVTKSFPICLFEVESGKHLVTFKGHSTDIHALSLTPDNKILASASHDGTILLWDLTPYIDC